MLRGSEDVLFRYFQKRSSSRLHLLALALSRSLQNWQGVYCPCRVATEPALILFPRRKFKKHRVRLQWLTNNRPTFVGDSQFLQTTVARRLYQHVPTTGPTAKVMLGNFFKEVRTARNGVSALGACIVSGRA